MSNPLSSGSILEHMAQALPTHDPEDGTSDLSSSLDAISLFAHACMASLDFKLVGFNEDDKIGMPCFSPRSLFVLLTKPVSPADECARLAPRLPPQWNTGLSSHSFVYTHTQSSMKFILRIDRLGGKIEIRGLATGDERIARFEIAARDYISSSSLPLRIPFSTPPPNAPRTEDRGAPLLSSLQSLFVSPARITDLASLLKVSIIQRLVPSLQKPGYQEDPDDRAARQDADAAGREGAGARPPPAMPNPLPDPVRPSPYPAPDSFAPPAPRPFPAGDFPPPGFEDEYEVNRPLRGVMPPFLGGLGGIGGPGGSPFGIGGSDLYPAGLGPDDPLRASFVPGRRSGPQPGSGGMHPTFDDPLFQGPRGQGDPSFDPQIPPGARWDPLGPGGAPRFGGGRPGGRGGGGFGGNSFGDII